MDARKESEPARMKNPTKVERKSERELVVTRTINGPARLVFQAWTRPELFQRWWVPKSMGMSLLTCEMDVRVGGEYRLVFGVGGSKVMEVFFSMDKMVGGDFDRGLANLKALTEKATEGRNLNAKG